MKVLIAGGKGFIGTALAANLRRAGHESWTLTRARAVKRNEICWNSKGTTTWASLLNEMDAVVNATGYGLNHWPWTPANKRRFIDSRVLPGLMLVEAIRNARHRPRVFVQMSGINYYGLRGPGIADESTPGADDFLARLTLKWESATSPVEELGVRRIVARSGIVLSASGGLLPLMALPTRIFIGGRLGDGKQAVSWIHLADLVDALRWLMESPSASGIYNLVAPTPTSNESFIQAIAKCLHRPYWLHAPAIALRAALGEMSVLVVEGRFSAPTHLLANGYRFAYASIESALADLFGQRRRAP
jgi:hypothetical protein